MSATINRPAIMQEINYDSIFIMFKILKPIINVKTGLNWAFSGVWRSRKVMYRTQKKPDTDENHARGCVPNYVL